jgi:hypothetical protein
MDFYFNINMDFTYAEKYSTLLCFHPLLHRNFNTMQVCDEDDFRMIVQPF